MSEQARPDLIGAHYGQHEVLAAIRAGLAAIGKADGPLTPDDLAPADQFHTRGKFATLELAERAGVSGAAASGCVRAASVEAAAMGFCGTLAGAAVGCFVTSSLAPAVLAGARGAGCARTLVSVGRGVAMA